jgi:hypothetical protein
VGATRPVGDDSMALLLCPTLECGMLDAIAPQCADVEGERMKEQRIGAKEAGGGAGGLSIWIFFSFMYFFTAANVLPLGKWEFVWRFFAGPINFLFD